MEDPGSSIHTHSSIGLGHELSPGSNVAVGHVFSFKSNVYEVFYGKDLPSTATAAPSRRCHFRPRLRLVLLASFGLNLAITTALLTGLWYTNNRDASEALLAQNARNNDLCTSACGNSIDAIASRLHAVMREEESVAVQKFLSEPIMVLQNIALLAGPAGSAVGGATDTKLRLLFWQLRNVFKGLEGIFYTDASGMYVEYERLSHHHGFECAENYSFEFALGAEVNATELNASCSELCPPIADLRTMHKSVFTVSEETGAPLRLLKRVPYDVESMPWHRAALASRGQVVWDGPRDWQGTVRYRVVQGMFERGEFRMMVGADFTLDYLSKFLEDTEMARVGLVFIVDLAGRVLSSSTPLETANDSNVETPHWEDVGEPLVRAVLSDMIRRAGGLERAGTSQDVRFLGEEGDPSHIYSHRQLRSGEGDYDFEWLVVNVQSLELYKGPFKRLVAESKGYVEELQEDLGERLHGSMVMMLCISVVFLLAEMTIICALAQAITIPLKALQNEMRAVARLDFNSLEDRLPRAASVDGELPGGQVVSRPCLQPCHSGKLAKRSTSRIQEIADIRDSFTSMAAGLQSFSRYMDPSLVRMLVQSKRQACLGVAKATVTIFFSDIANFTALAETLPQKRFMSMLGKYLDCMSSIIMSNGGIVGEFIGDAIMAWWNAPEDLGEWHSVLALTAALEQQACLRSLREQWARAGLPEVHTRMGLARGEVLAGNIGSPERMKYGLVGDTVNLASRLESLCKRYKVDIIIDDVARNAPGVEDAFLLRPLGLVTVKGRSSTTELFELVGLREQGEPEGSELESFCSGFAAAQALYRLGAFSKTLDLLSVYERRWPDDWPAQMLRQRCQDLIACPPGPDWSPVEELFEK